MEFETEKIIEAAQFAISRAKSAGVDGVYVNGILNKVYSTRFANSAIHQNFTNIGSNLMITVVGGLKNTNVTLNTLDEKEIARSIDYAVKVVNLLPDDPTFPGLLTEAQNYKKLRLDDPSIKNLSSEDVADKIVAGINSGHEYSKKVQTVSGNLNFSDGVSIFLSSENLENITPDIRRAVSQAYRKNRLDLPFIMNRRGIETGQIIPESQQEKLGQVLDNLRRYTIQLDLPDKSDLDQISAMASVQANPFQSELPIIGGLVAFLRDLWSRIAVKPFVAPLLDQQNDINKLLVERFSDSIRMLDEKDQLQTDRVVSMSDNAAQIRKLNETFIQLDRRIELLERKDPGQDDGDGQP